MSEIKQASHAITVGLSDGRWAGTQAEDSVGQKTLEKGTAPNYRGYLGTFLVIILLCYRIVCIYTLTREPENFLRSVHLPILNLKAFVHLCLQMSHFKTM